ERDVSEPEAVNGAVMVRAQDQQIRAELAGLVHNGRDCRALDGQSALHTHTLAAQRGSIALCLLMLHPQRLRFPGPYDIVLVFFTAIAGLDIADEIRLRRSNVDDVDDGMERKTVPLCFREKPVGSGLQVDGNDDAKIFVHDRSIVESTSQIKRGSTDRCALPELDTALCRANKLASAQKK